MVECWSHLRLHIFLLEFYNYKLNLLNNHMIILLIHLHIGSVVVVCDFQVIDLFYHVAKFMCLDLFVVFIIFDVCRFCRGSSCFILCSCDLYFPTFFCISLIRGLPILLMFSKNQLFVPLILSNVFLLSILSISALMLLLF